MLNTKNWNKFIVKRTDHILNKDLFSHKIVRIRPVFLLLFLFGLMAIFYLAVLNPDLIFSIITGLALFTAGFLISNLFFLSTSGQKEDSFNRSVIQNSSDLFLVFDVRRGQFKHVSSGLENLLGYDETSILNQYDLTFVHPADRFELYNILDKNFLRLHRSFTATLRMIKRGGTVCWINIKGDVVVNASNELEQVVLNFREVTREKEQSIAQHQYLKSLEQSIQKKSFKTHEYEEIADLMSSYDLKEPLRTISSYSRLVQQRYGDHLDESGREFIQYTIDGANRMTRMMDDILSFSNIRMEKWKPREINVTKAVREVEHVLNKELKSLKAKVIYEHLPTIHIDFIQFKLLIKNLIENALKFRGSDTPVIQISAEEQVDAWQFSVTDNGIGIAKAYHESIFEVFGKIRGYGNLEGTGIGWALCKKIVQNHNGKIWVTSNGKGTGTTFCFSIPKMLVEVPDNQRINSKESYPNDLTFKKLKLHI
ncbi:MAG: ATP-binding protein [Bacteroidota bacterium]